MPITQKEDGTYTADGHSWICTDYEVMNDRYYEVHYLVTIDGDSIREKQLRRIDITKDVLR